MGAPAMSNKSKPRISLYMTEAYKEKLEQIARALRAERLENVSLSDAVREAIDYYWDHNMEGKEDL